MWRRTRVRRSAKRHQGWPAVSVFAHGQIAVDVFNLDRGVIHQDSDGQRQPSQGHDVDGLAQRAEHDDGAENRQRNGNRDDQRAAPVAEEKQDHGRGETAAISAFAHHALDGGAHKQRLIEERLHIHAVGQCGVQRASTWP